MAVIQPFKGWLPDPRRVADIACVPYDVISTEEARTMAAGRPDHFLRVVRPEITCPAGTDIHSDEVYEAGAAEWEAFRRRGVFTQDDVPSVYIYQLEWRGRTQTGLFGGVTVSDYDQGVILKHELTRPDKEEDRTRTIIAQSAHAEPVMLTFRDEAGIGSMMADDMARIAPFIDFTAEDGIAHRIWKITDPGRYVAAFATIPHLYVADGHHRCKSASNAAARYRAGQAILGQDVAGQRKEGGGPGYDCFPAVVFPMDEMEILAYNRAVVHADAAALARFTASTNPAPADRPVPVRRGTACAYVDGQWLAFELPAPAADDAVSRLDASRLQTGVLEPFFGIGDPRIDSNVFFVGGMRGTSELERLVDEGRASITFSMYPTSIRELLDVSDAGLLMPPKSTWFEPKLRSGLVVHTF